MIIWKFLFDMWYLYLYFPSQWSFKKTQFLIYMWYFYLYFLTYWSFEKTQILDLKGEQTKDIYFFIIAIKESIFTMLNPILERFFFLGSWVILQIYCSIHTVCPRMKNTPKGWFSKLPEKKEKKYLCYKKWTT